MLAEEIDAQSEDEGDLTAPCGVECYLRQSKPGHSGLVTGFFHLMNDEYGKSAPWNSE